MAISLNFKHFQPVFILFFTMLFCLAGCTGLQIDKINQASAPDIPEDARPAPIALNKIGYSVPTGANTLSHSPRAFLGPIMCKWPFGTFQSGLSGRNFPNREMRRIFQQSMEGVGYDVAGDPGRMFDEQEDLMRAHYAVGARVIDVKIDVCEKEPLFIFSASPGTIGEANITIEWSVYDYLHKKTVYKTTTQGYGRVKRSNYEAIPLLMQQAFEMATHNLGADETFRDLIVFGIEPENQPDSIPDPREEPMMRFDPREDVTLPPLASSTIAANGRFETITKNAVLVEVAGGHGSGFFITDQGHILTNAHVVGYAPRARIVTSGKKEKLIAEVLRYDRQRDIALLKLEDMPDDLDIRLQPIKTEKPAVGATVYSVGAPSYKYLQDTVTSGIISAHRFHVRRKTDYMQADVDIHGGNSGGPLYDENGNIVGICVSGFVNESGALSGLNNFIPIASALDFLDIAPPPSR